MSHKLLTAFIFARGGSKGIINKNIKEVAGKPLIAHSILCALESKFINKVIVSTDDPAIAEISKSYGAEVLMRPPELATDNSPEILSWKHAIEATKSSSGAETIFISLPATSPLRSPVDVDNAIIRYEKKDCDIVFGITPSHRNPYLNMVSIDDQHLIHIAIEGSQSFRRQDVPKMYDITTSVYVSGTNYISSCAKLMEGKVGYILIPPERSLDIDEEYDLYLANIQLTNPYKENTR